MSINGLTLNVLVQGEGDPVLLPHGFLDSTYLWRGSSLGSSGSVMGSSHRISEASACTDRVSLLRAVHGEERECVI